MKIKVNDKEIFTLTEHQKKVIQNDILLEGFDEDMIRRVQWVLTHKYERCLHRLKEEWIPKLELEKVEIPKSDEDLCSLIFSRSDYKNRSQRDEEERLKFKRRAIDV